MWGSHLRREFVWADVWGSWGSYTVVFLDHPGLASSYSALSGVWVYHSQGSGYFMTLKNDFKHAWLSYSSCLPLLPGQRPPRGPSEKLLTHDNSCPICSHARSPIFPLGLGSAQRDGLRLHLSFSCALHSATLVFREKCCHDNCHNRWYLISL